MTCASANWTPGKSSASTPTGQHSSTSIPRRSLPKQRRWRGVWRVLVKGIGGELRRERNSFRMRVYIKLIMPGVTDEGDAFCLRHADGKGGRGGTRNYD